jgi:hypothetical protein
MTINELHFLYPIPSAEDAAKTFLLPFSLILTCGFIFQTV